MLEEHFGSRRNFLSERIGSIKGVLQIQNLLKQIKEVVLFFQMKSQKIWQIGFLHVFGVVQMYTQKE